MNVMNEKTARYRLFSSPTQHFSFSRVIIFKVSKYISKLVKTACKNIKFEEI